MKKKKGSNTRKKTGKNRSEAYRRINNRINILSRAESQHNVIVDIRPEGMAGRDCHIDSKIPRPPEAQKVTTNLPSGH